MTYSLQLSFNTFDSFIEECKPLQKILNSGELFDFESLSKLCDYLQEKRDAIESSTFVESSRISSAKSKVQQLKETRFKGHKQLVDSFVITSVNKLAILIYQQKEEGGKFNFIWSEYLN
jgi:hypothetical protein